MPAFDLLCASGAWKTIDWDGSPLRVGRDEACSIQIDESGVPSVFAIFEMDEEGAVVRAAQLGTSICVDGASAPSLRLHDRGSVPVGSCFIVYRKDGSFDYSDEADFITDTEPAPLSLSIDLPDDIFGDSDGLGASLSSSASSQSPELGCLICVGGKSRGETISFSSDNPIFDASGVLVLLDLSVPGRILLNVHDGVVFVNKKRVLSGNGVEIAKDSLIGLGSNLWRWTD